MGPAGEYSPVEKRTPCETVCACIEDAGLHAIITARCDIGLQLDILVPTARGAGYQEWVGPAIPAVFTVLKVVNITTFSCAARLRAPQ